MTPVLVDSNVILDVTTNDAAWADWSGDALRRAAEEAVLVINPLIYAEVSIGHDRIELLEAVLADAFRRDSLPWEAAFLAGKCLPSIAGGLAIVGPRCRISISAPMPRSADSGF